MPAPFLVPRVFRRRRVTLLTSLTFAYRLDEGVIWHDEVAGLDLTATNGPVSVAGYVGNAVDLERDSLQYLSRASHANFSFVDEDWTVGVVARAESLAPVNSLAVIISKYQYSAGLREWALAHRASNNRFEAYIGSSTDTTTTVIANSLGAPATGTWYRFLFGHVAATSILWIRVNGGTKDEIAAITPHSSTAAFIIGSINTGIEYHWDGLVDAVCGWRRTLTAAEETAWFANPQHPFGL